MQIAHSKRAGKARRVRLMPRLVRCLQAVTYCPPSYLELSGKQFSGFLLNRFNPPSCVRCKMCCELYFDSVTILRLPGRGRGPCERAYLYAWHGAKQQNPCAWPHCLALPGCSVLANHYCAGIRCRSKGILLKCDQSLSDTRVRHTVRRSRPKPIGDQNC